MFTSLKWDIFHENRGQVCFIHPYTTHLAVTTELKNSMHLINICWMNECMVPSTGNTL